jgi:hypothetical protein
LGGILGFFLKFRILGDFGFWDFGGEFGRGVGGMGLYIFWEFYLGGVGGAASVRLCHDLAIAIAAIIGVDGARVTPAVHVHIVL